MNFERKVMKGKKSLTLCQVLSIVLIVMVMLSSLLVSSVAVASADITQDGHYRIPVKMFRTNATDLSYEATTNISTANGSCTYSFVKTVDGVPYLTLQWKPTIAMGGSVVPTDFKYFANSSFTGLETSASVDLTYPITAPVLGNPTNPSSFPVGTPFPKEISFPIPSYALSGDTFVAMSLNIFGMPAPPAQQMKVKIYLDMAVETEMLELDGWHEIPASLVQESSETTSMCNPALVSPVYVHTVNGVPRLYTQWMPLHVPFGPSVLTGYLTSLKYYLGNTWGGALTDFSVDSYQYREDETRPKVMSVNLDSGAQEYVFVLMDVDLFTPLGMPSQNARIKLDLANAARIANYDIPGSDEAPVPTVDNVTISSFKATAFNKTVVTWKAVSKADGYVIEYKTSTDAVWESIDLADGTKTSYTLTGLKTGKKYQVRIKAYRTANGKTGFSVAYSSTLSAVPKLGKVIGLKAKKSGAKRIKLSWKKVAGRTKYVVYQKAGNGKWKKAKTTSAASFKTKSLKKGVIYRFKVRAYRTVGKAKVYGAYSTVAKCKR